MSRRYSHFASGDNWTAVMSAEDFRSLVAVAFGKGGQSRFAFFTGISRSQVSRYANGGKIPRHIAVLLLLAIAARDAGYSLTTFAPGLRPDGSANGSNEREVRGPTH